MILIGVVGGDKAPDRILGIAKEVGSGIAKGGCALVCGGLGGVMEASAKGAKESGGLTIGILPGFDRKEANAYIDIPIVTGMSHARNAIVARTADAIIVVDGELGTLSELALGLKMGKPVIIIEGAEPSPNIVGATGILRASTPEEAVALAIKKAKEKVGSAARAAGP